MCKGVNLLTHADPLGIFSNPLPRIHLLHTQLPAPPMSMETYDELYYSFSDIPRRDDYWRQSINERAR